MFPVNPAYDEVGGAKCFERLDKIDLPIDLVMMAVPDAVLERAGALGVRSAVIFGSVVEDEDAARGAEARHGENGISFEPGADGGRRGRIAAIARRYDMALCGGGCMGFVNVVSGLRAIGYLEPDPVRCGPIALVTHSGSIFSALLRADRRLGFTLVVSSGQELVTTAADYLEYALSLEETGVLALCIETIRATEKMKAVLARAAALSIPVVALVTGSSAAGRAMVRAHSGALLGSNGAIEALLDAYGVVQVSDLEQLVDTLELFAMGRRARAGGTPGARGVGGLATVHDSGFERALVTDAAAALGVPFAVIGESAKERLLELLDPGLEPGNPLDLWGTKVSTRTLVAESLVALASEPAVAAVALAVDLVPEHDGDASYPEAMLDVLAATSIPVCVLSNLASAIDRAAARRLRDAGVAVLEGTRSGLAALGHLMGFGAEETSSPDPPPQIHPERRARWRARLEAAPRSSLEALELCADYGIASPPAAAAASRSELTAAARRLGYPVVLKTDRPGTAHKSELGGVRLHLEDEADLLAAYDDVAARLGPSVIVAVEADAGVELSLAVLDDPVVGPLVVLYAGGTLIELLADRAVGLVPFGARRASELLERLRVDLSDRLVDLPGASPSARKEGDIARTDLDRVVAVLGDGHPTGEDGDELVGLERSPRRAGRALPEATLAVLVGISGALGRTSPERETTRCHLGAGRLREWPPRLEVPSRRRITQVERGGASSGVRLVHASRSFLGRLRSRNDAMTAIVGGCPSRDPALD